jgi:hypothetical protein
MDHSSFDHWLLSRLDKDEDEDDIVRGATFVGEDDDEEEDDDDGAVCFAASPLGVVDEDSEGFIGNTLANPAFVPAWVKALPPISSLANASFAAVALSTVSKLMKPHFFCVRTLTDSIAP